MTKHLDALLTLTAVQITPQAIPKPTTKLDRAIARKAARLDDKKRLEQWARAVKDRDRWRDRKTGQRVRSTRDLDPRRSEAHHIEPKENQAVRYDVRNGLCLSFETHYLITTNRLRIEGTQYFRKAGVKYIDATYPVTFVRV